MTGWWSMQQAFRVVGVAAVLVVLSGLQAASWAAEMGPTDDSSPGALGTPPKKSVFRRGNEEVLSTLKWTGFAVLVAAVAAGTCLAIRRRRQWRRTATDGHRLEIVDRLALSPKHWACLLRVEGRLLVVGMTPDRMRTLALFDDDAKTPAESTPNTKGDSYWFRPASEGGRSGVLDENLAPYRREVTRLRAMLQNPGDESADPPPKERSDR